MPSRRNPKTDKKNSRTTPLQNRTDSTIKSPNWALSPITESEISPLKPTDTSISILNKPIDVEDEIPSKDERPDYLEHGTLLDIMRSLGYKITNRGACFGFAAMATQAILSGELDKLIERSEFINKHDTQDIIDKLKTLKKKLKKFEEKRKIETENQKTIIQDLATTIKANEISLVAIKKELARTQRTRTTMVKVTGLRNKERALEESIKADNELLQHAQNKLDRLGESMQLSSEDQKYMDLLAFFEGVNISHLPREFTELFSPEHAPEGQNILMSSILTQSIALENKGGFAEAGKFSGIYTKKELIEYLEGFLAECKALKTTGELKDPMTLFFSNFRHAISISYDPKNDIWIFIDLNQLNEIKIPANKRNTKFLAELLNHGYMQLNEKEEQKKGCMTLITTVYTTGQNAEAGKKIIENWQKKSSWVKLHSKEHTKRTDPNNNTWLHAAAKMDDDIILDKINKDHILLENNKRQTPFSLAASRGNLTLLKKFIKMLHNPPIDTALYGAILRGQLEIANYLVPLVNIDSPTSKGRYYLHTAASLNRTKILQELINYSNNIDQVNEEGETALEVALTRNHIASVKILLDAGASPYNGINFAATYGIEEQFKLLIQYVNLDEIAEGHLTPVQSAISYNNDELALLAIHQQVFNSEDLRWAIQHGTEALIEAMLVQDPSIINGLLQPDNVTPLFYAAYVNQPSVVNLLLNAGADPQTVTENGTNPLMIAAKKGHVEVVECLIEHINPNLSDNRGLTALHASVRAKQTAAVNKLLEYKIDIDKPNMKGDTALELAIKCKAGNSIIKALLKKGADPIKSINNAIEKDDREMFNLLLKYVTIDHINDFSTTPLARAINNNHSEMAEKLIDNGLFTSEDFIYAITNAQSNLVWRMLENGANANSTNETKPPLHYAVESGDTKTIEYLINKGANPGATFAGKTAYQLAQELGKQDLLKILAPRQTREKSEISVTSFSILNGKKRKADQVQTKNIRQHLSFNNTQNQTAKNEDSKIKRTKIQSK